MLILAKNLIRNLLVVNPEDRLSIDQVMQNPWLNNFHDVPNSPLDAAGHHSVLRHGWGEIMVCLNYHLPNSFVAPIEESKNRINQCLIKIYSWFWIISILLLINKADSWVLFGSVKRPKLIFLLLFIWIRRTCKNEYECIVFLEEQLHM